MSNFVVVLRNSMNIPTAFLDSKSVIVGVYKCLFLLYQAIIVFYFW